MSILIQNFKNFSTTKSDGVFYVGHASILIRLNGKTILCDPSGLDDPYFNAWYYYPPQVLPEELYNVDYVFISHIHKDHLDKVYLKNISKRTKVIILDHRPTLENELSSLGIKFKVIPHAESFCLCENVYIKGFVNLENKIDSSAIFYNDKFSVYHGNDNWVDIKEIERFLSGRQLDVACVPFAFVYWYPFEFTNLTRDERDSEAKRLIEEHLDYGINFIKKIKPDIMIPFGSNLVHFTGAYSECNLAVKTPLEFLEYALEKIPKDTGCIEPLHANDYILSLNGKNNITKEKRSLESYRIEMNEYIEKRLTKSSPESYFERFETKDKEEFLMLVKNRIEEIPNLDQLLVVESSCTNYTLSINFKNKEVKFIDKEEMRVIDMPYHIFTLDKLMSKAYFSGDVNFDAVLGTRRFKVYRNPDIHCRKTFAFIATQI
jgi:L-ascorbate metabolism protein UlaG (beta-lactamase superfamily)